MISKFYYLCFLLLFFPVSYYVEINFVLAAVLLVNLFIGLLRDRKQMQEYLSNHTFFMTLWFLWTLVSYFWSLDFLQWRLQSMVVFTALIHAIYLRRYRENKKTLFFIFILANVLHNLIGWTQILLLGNIIPESLFYNQNFLATYLLFSFIVIVFYQTNHFELESPMKYALLLSNFLLILFADSRGITTLTIFMLFVILYFKMNFEEKNKVFGVLLLLLTVTGGLVLLFTDVVTLVLTDLSIVIRWNLVQTGLYYWREQPIIGLGAGSIVYLLEHYPINYIEGLTVLHNWWAGLLVTHGLIFFIIYMIRYLGNGYVMGKMAFHTKNPKPQMIVTFSLAMIIAVKIPDSLFHSLWFWTMMNMIWTDIEELKEKDSVMENSWVKKFNIRSYLKNY